MGDNFLEDQAKNTRKRRAKAAAKRGTPKLFDRSDRVTEEFTIDCLDGTAVKTGDLVLCFPGQNGLPLDVVIENRLFGSVGEIGGGGVLRQRIEEFGVGKLRITSYCDLAGTARAELIQE